MNFSKSRNTVIFSWKKWIIEAQKLVWFLTNRLSHKVFMILEKAKMMLHIKYIKCRRVLSSVPCKNYKSVCAILPISFWFMSSCNFCSSYVFFESSCSLTLLLFILLHFIFYLLTLFLHIWKFLDNYRAVDVVNSILEIF